MKYLFLSIFYIMLMTQAFSQEKNGRADYYKENYLRYQDYVYRDNIKTVMLYKEGFELSAPVLAMNSDNKLLLGFDDLEGGVKNFKYTFIHCDADWKPAIDRPSDYLEGYYEDYIEHYRFSFNTLQPYTHYELVFPTGNMKIKRSGNYLLLVFPENDRDNPVLSSRFFVVDQKVTVRGQVRQPAGVEERMYSQQLVFSVYTPAYRIVNPFRNLTVVLRQNGRWDNAISNLKPLLVKGDELDYHHDAGNIFSGGNEFRRFDLKSVKYPSERALRVEPGDPLYHVILKPDDKKTYKVYLTEDDMNGRMFIKTLDAADPATEADYVKVSFTLPCTPPFDNGNLYLMGAFMNWNFSKDVMLKYDYVRKAYEASLFLKQGYYNYQYVFVENGRTAGDESLVEGSHYETENDYSIFVYYREPGTDYDQLIAAESVISRAK